MFNKDFFPTPTNVIELMMQGYDVRCKICYEPSAGSGNIVDWLKQHGATVIASEKHPDLRAIVANKCKVIADDFLTVKSEDISHVDYIIMNPPFSADERHMLHAFTIAPSGCTVISLCNAEVFKNRYSSVRRELYTTIQDNGYFHDLGNVFSDADRQTDINIGLVVMRKPGAGGNEFEGFFMDEEVEEQANGIMPYNLVRDLVNRYVEAVNIYKRQLDAAVQMNNLTNGFYSSKLAMSITENDKPKNISEFKKDLQKSAWSWVFKKMKMGKYVTKGLRDDINKFVEKQSEIPFTMRNIYHMINVVVGTHSSRMDKALLDVFERLTKHYDENRYQVEGWKTNSHYLVNEKFILNYLVGFSFSGRMEVKTYSNSNADLIEDFAKALCFITGTNYDNLLSLHDTVGYRYKIKVGGKVLNNRRYMEHTYEKIKETHDSLIKSGEQAEIYDSPCIWGQWFDWAFFEVKAYKKGTMHFKFKDKNVWALFNQNIARIMGYPLPESVKKHAKAA